MEGGGTMAAMGGAAEAEGARPSLLGSALATYATNLIVAVLSLGNVLVVARALGPEGRGGVAFLTTIGVLTSSLATLGVEQANANLAGRERSLRRVLATNSVALAVALGTLAAAVVLALVGLAPGVAGDTDRGLLLLVLALVPVLIAKVYFDYLVRAEYGHSTANVAWLLEALANVAGNAILAAAGTLSVGRAVGVWIGGQVIASLVLARFLARRGDGFGAAQLVLARRQLAFGAKTHAGRVMTLGNYRLDQWLVGAIAGTRELGLYSVAVAWAEALFFLPTALSLAQRPDLVRATPADAARQAAVATRVALLLTLPATIAIVVLAPFLVETVFGAEFADATDDLRVLAWGALGIVVLKLLGTALTAQGMPLRATAGVGVSFVATIALDLLLVPDHGGLGAAIASTTAYAVGGIATWVLFSRSFGLGWKELLPGLEDVAALRRLSRRLSAGWRTPRAE